MATAGPRVAARDRAPVPVRLLEGGFVDPARPPSMVPAWARDSPTNRASHVVPMSGPASVRSGVAGRPTEVTGRAARDSASRPDPTRPIDRARTDPASAASTGRDPASGGGRDRPGHVPAGPAAEPAPAPTSDRAIVRPPARTRARTWSKANEQPARRAVSRSTARRPVLRPPASRAPALQPSASWLPAYEPPAARAPLRRAPVLQPPAGPAHRNRPAGSYRDRPQAARSIRASRQARLRSIRPRSTRL